MDDDAEAVTLFIKGGMSPDLKVDGSPVLTSAAMFGKVKVALALIAAGANPNASDGACTPIIRAADKGPVELIEALIKAGADVNAKAAGGATALMLAEVMKRDDIVAVLKKAGAK
jgi:ankyrin repeat protein